VVRGLESGVEVVELLRAVLLRAVLLRAVLLLLLLLLLSLLVLLLLLIMGLLLLLLLLLPPFSLLSFATPVSPSTSAAAAFSSAHSLAFSYSLVRTVMARFKSQKPPTSIVSPRKYATPTNSCRSKAYKMFSLHPSKVTTSNNVSIDAPTLSKEARWEAPTK